MKGGADFVTVAALLALRIEDLTRDLLGDPSQRRHHEWRFRSRGSLQVMIAGSERGTWRDFETGKWGDALGLVAHLRHVPMREARRWALGWLGAAGQTGVHLPARHREAATSKPSPTADHKRWSRELARRTWMEGMPIIGTPVERYLRDARRVLLPDAPDVLRYHPECPRESGHMPAMIALMTRPEADEPCGLHRTFILPDGSDRVRVGMAKGMLGDAGVIRLTPDEDVTLGLGIAEGIETALSIYTFGWRPVWAAGSAGAIASFRALAGLEALTIFADPGSAGANAAQACAACWAAAARDALIATPPRGDFNDLIREQMA